MRNAVPSALRVLDACRRARRSATLAAPIVATVAASVALLAGCATIDNQGVRVAAPIEAPAAPKVITESASSAERKRMVALFGEYKDPAVERYINEMLAKFAATGDIGGKTYKVTILDSPIVNAFALPSGDLFVTRGLLALANDGSELAAVMAHEIAHVTEKHEIARTEQMKRAAVISKVAHLVQTKHRGDQVEALSKVSIAGFSRQQEMEADERGIHTIAAAGYDPYGASRFLEALKRSAALRESLIGQNASAAKPDILATHPSTPERIIAATKVARSISAPGIGTTDRDPYLTAINGLMFGDDPSGGSIRGRTFIQPKLGFVFTAPDGFVLENSSQAVLGIKDGGAEALRLDSVAVAADQTLDAYLRSGWIDGLLDSTIEKATVNGMPAMIAQARAGEWNFQVAVLRYGDSDEVYRLIFATHALDPAHEKTYRVAIDSFRKIDAEEAAKIKPLRISIVTAKEGESAGAVSARMVVPDKPLETFELLNGLQSAEPVKPGRRYKLVVE